MEAITLTKYEKRLASAFLHDPKEYAFIGETNGSVCECGHKIKTAYIVSHPHSGHTLLLGSECINNYEHLGEALKALQEEKKAQDKLAKEVEMFEELNKLIEEAAAIYGAIYDYKEEAGYVQYEVYSAWRNGFIAGKGLKSVKGKIRAQKAKNKEMMKLCEHYGIEIRG